MPTVFLSYSHKDEVWKDRLATHLRVLEIPGLDTWDDRRIKPGADWFEDIQEAMATAGVAVLLISADFLTSEFIRGEEVPKLLERRSREGLPVIPVIVRTCAWDDKVWLQRIQALPKDGQALASFEGDRIDQELTKIAREVQGILQLDEDGRDRLHDREDRGSDDFLDRVAAVSRLREPEAEIRRFPGIGDVGGYLRVVRRDGDLQDVHPVGAVEYGLTQELFQAFLTEIDAPYRKNDPGMISRLVYGGGPAPADLLAEASRRRVRLVSFVEHQGLIDFRAYISRQTVTLTNDSIYPPSLYVPQRMRTLSILGREEDETADALAQVQGWLDASIGRFIVLLGDFGTGKTFLLHELARRMGKEKGGLVPVLLQMRSLEKGRSLDALLAQHFAQERMESFTPAKFRYMLKEGRIALLFDGFDELALRVTYSKAADHFATLLQAAAGNAKVVLTSRRQHFLSESQVKTALAQQVELVSGHRLAILRQFDRDQVRLFLINFFKGDEQQAEARLDLIDRIKDLLGLSANPRLLGFIADLPGEQLNAACTKGGEITAGKLYELLLNRWLIFEFNRIHPTGAPPGLSVEERWKAVTLVAMRLWQKTDRFVSLSDLSEETARVVQAVGPAALDSEVAAFQVGSGTLLVRDEEGNFAFLHQSILEWLVAWSAAEELRRGSTPAGFSAREISPLMADFFADLAGRDLVITWARGVLSSPAGEMATKNAFLMLERQGEMLQGILDLAGRDLRGGDFSGHDFSGADLSDVDLTEARLIGTDLSKARLVKATLRDADLSRADLSQADLTEADFTGASLLGADLQGARFTSARLQRAKLLRSIMEEGGVKEADTFGAATGLDEFSPQGIAAWGYDAVAWSPDGELLASAAGSVVRLWETRRGRQIRIFGGHRGAVLSVAFSPDGKMLASGSEDQTVRLWKVESGFEIRAFIGHRNGVVSVAFSPDGESIVSGSDDQTIRLWQVENGSEIKAFSGHLTGVISVAFSPDGKTLASGSYDETVRLWQIESGIEIRTLSGHENSVWSVAFSPDGKILASGSSDKTVRLWKVETGSTIKVLTSHEAGVWSVAFSPDGQYLASASADQTIRLWQMESGSEIRAFVGHQRDVMSIAFSPDGKSLASGSPDQTVRLWRVGSESEVKALVGLQNSIMSVAFSPDGKSLVGGSSDSTVRLWQVDSGRETGTLIGHPDCIASVAFSPDGKKFASASADQTVRLWQVDSGREIGVFKGSKKAIWSVAFSPDGANIASGSDDAVCLWQVGSGVKTKAFFMGSKNPVRSVVFSPDGKALASGSDDSIVRLWQLESGHFKAYTGHQAGVWGVAFNPDGKSLASASGDTTVRLWHVENEGEIRCLLGHRDAVLSVAFSPDGKSLASGSDDHTVRLWEVDSGREVRTLTGHQGRVVSVAFSPAGKTLASASFDGTIRLWNVADGRCLAVLLSLPEGWVAYSPDGRYKFGGVPAGGFWHVASLCRFEIGELDEWVPGLRLADDASFFDLPAWKPEVVVPERASLF